MNKQHAQNLARALASADLSGSSYELIDVDRSPVYRGGNHVGTFKFSRGNEPWLKLSVVVWLKGASKE